MKNSILNLGEALNKAKQRNINGGFPCNTQEDCSNQPLGEPFKNQGWVCLEGSCFTVYLMIYFTGTLI